MKRTPFKRRSIKPHPKAPKPLVPKALGHRLEPKEEARKEDPAHLAKIRAQPCLICSKFPPSEPHHCRKLRPSGLTARHDALCVPLCRIHHRAMDGDERSLWRHYYIDPAAWIASFSEEGRQAIAELTTERRT